MSDRIMLADGRTIPVAAVEALAALDEKWPGATLPQARPAIVAAVLAVLAPDIGWLKTPHKWEMFKQPGANIETCRLCGCGVEHPLHRPDIDTIAGALMQATRSYPGTSGPDPDYWRVLARAAVDAMKGET